MIRRTPIRKVSSKRAKQLRCYRLLRDAYLEAHQVCQFPLCNAHSVDLHHRAKRHGDNLNNVDEFRALCRYHHTYCHEHPAEARRLGLLK